MPFKVDFNFSVIDNVRYKKFSLTMKEELKKAQNV